MKKGILSLLIFFILTPIFSTTISPEEFASLANSLFNERASFSNKGEQVSSIVTTEKDKDDVLHIRELILVSPKSVEEAKQEVVEVKLPVEEEVVDKTEEVPVVKETKVNSKKGLFIGFDSHITFIRNTFTPNYGLSLFTGIGSEKLLSHLFFRFDYITMPLGSSSALVATKELSLEAGVNLRANLFSFSEFSLMLGSDIGYFVQLLESPEVENVIFRGNNGLIVRPEFSVDVSLYKFDIEFGIFYQKVLSSSFKSYDGYGAFIRLY